MLRIDGIDLAGIVSGVDFLRSVALGELTEQKGKTVVIGGGNVAIDVARTAVRLGAASTNLFCLESKAEMPALEEEQNEASAEGVVLNNGWGPKRILGENGKVTGVEFMRCVSVFDENGKFAPKYDENDIVVVECENVLLSVGQTMDWGKLLDGSQMQLSARKTLSVKEVSYQTEEADVFAGGDAVSGPKFAIDAIAMGKSGAVSIHRYLRGRSLTMRREREYKPFNTEAADFSGFDKMPRQRPLAVDHKKAAGTMADLRGNFTEEQLQKEAKRCLGCGVAVVDPYMCVGCGLCANKCEFDALHLVKVDNPVASATTPMDYMTDVYTYMMSREAKLAAKEAEAQK